jgi:hypothetical protein
MRRLPALFGALALCATAALAIAPTAAASARHVGVVVRYANGRVSAGCARVGGTGLELLGQHHAVRMGTQQYSGFVIEIDGVGTPRPDDTHYWSYWHSGGNGGWRYSSSGAASYRPKAGTVEGWSYVNGQGSAPRPPSRTYAALCGRLDPHAVPRSTAPSSSTASARSTASAGSAAPSTVAPAASNTRPAPHAGAPVSVARSRAVATAAAPAPHTRAAKRTASRPPVARSSARSTTSTRSHHATAPPTRHSPRPAPATSPAPSIAAQPAADTSGTNAWPTLGALAVVAALGVTAWVVMRRRAG